MNSLQRCRDKCHYIQLHFHPIMLICRHEFGRSWPRCSLLRLSWPTDFHAPVKDTALPIRKAGCSVMTKIAFLASHNGSAARAIANACIEWCFARAACYACQQQCRIARLFGMGKRPVLKTAVINAANSQDPDTVTASFFLKTMKSISSFVPVI